MIPFRKSRELYREEYPSERAALDEVPKCLCSIFKWKCLSDDRLHLARLEKLCNRRPCFRPSRYRLREQHEAFDAGTLPDQVRHIDSRFPARYVAERGKTAARRQDPERIAQDVATNTVHDYVCTITIREATYAFRQSFRREVDNLGEAQFLRLFSNILSAHARAGAICGTGAFCSIRFCALRSAQNSAGIFICMEV